MLVFAELVVGALALFAPGAARADVGFVDSIKSKRACCAVTVLGGKVDEACTSGTVTHVELTLSASESPAFSLGVSGTNPRVLQSSAMDSLWVAAYAASRTTGRPLSGYTLVATAHMPLEGVSAGLPQALGVASALEGRSLPGDFAATGEILPNGVVGPVDEIAVKIATASRASTTTGAS